MRIFDLLVLSTRMFKARTSRTILTILGMGVGIGAILFLVSLGYGLQKTLLEKITTSDSLLTLDVTATGTEGVELKQGLFEEIENMDGVAEVSPRFNISSRGRMGDLTSDLLVSGIKPSFIRLSGTKIFSGELLSDEQAEGVIITTSAAQGFNKSVQDVIGQEINFDFSVPDQNGTGSSSKNIQSKTKYKIMGVVEEDENVVYVNSLTLDYLGIKKYDHFKVKAISSSLMNDIRDKITEKGLSVSALSDAIDQANKVFRVIQVVLGFFGVIALIVSAIGMFNTMTIALLERTREIGIMKSIGASDMVISLIFITEATIMGFLGAVGGVLMGFITGKFFNILINVVATRFGGQKIELFATPLWFVLMIVIFGTVVGSLTGAIPARRASRIDPLDALRNR